MDVELHILKHLARSLQATVSVLDEYCEAYKEIFPEVRSYECLKYLHLGIISEIKRKFLPEIAKIVGIKSAQSLHHFLANSPWSVRELKEKRLTKTLAALRGKEITEEGYHALTSSIICSIGNLSKQHHDDCANE